MLPQPLQRAFIALMSVAVLLMFAGAADADYGVGGFALFFGTFLMALIAKVVLALRKGERPRFEVDADTRAWVRRRLLRGLSALVVAGVALLAWLAWDEVVG